MEIQCHIIFLKHRFWKIHELKTFGTRKRTLRKKLEGCSCDRKHPVVFWTFHTSPCIFSRELFLVAVHGWFAIQTNVWKVQNTTGRFLSQLHPSNFVLKILFLVPKVSNSGIFQKRCFMKIIWHWISIQTLLFQACLPTRQNGVEGLFKGPYLPISCSDLLSALLHVNYFPGCFQFTLSSFSFSYGTIYWFLFPLTKTIDQPKPKRAIKSTVYDIFENKFASNFLLDSRLAPLQQRK